LPRWLRREVEPAGSQSGFVAATPGRDTNLKIRMLSISSAGAVSSTAIVEASPKKGA
jgi:hypothetical protein